MATGATPPPACWQPPVKNSKGGRNLGVMMAATTRQNIERKTISFSIKVLG